MSRRWFETNHLRSSDEIADEETPLVATAGNDDAFAPGYFSLQRSFSDSWNNYTTILEKHPLLTKGITAFFLLGLGDLCGQGVEHVRGTATEGVDWPRTARFGVFGLLGAPWAHYYFYYLDLYLPPTPQPWTRTTLVKLLIDQGVQAPLLLAFIICALSIMRGEGIDGAILEMKETYVGALYANCTCGARLAVLALCLLFPVIYSH